jgi:DNA-binding NarL/FixJ family response regulator
MKPLPVCVEVVGPALAREAVHFLLADMPEVRLATPDPDSQDNRIRILLRLRDAAAFPNYDWTHGVLIAGGEPKELLDAAAMGIVVFVHADDEPERLLEALFAAAEARPYTTPRLSIPIIRALQLATTLPDPTGVTAESLARLTPVERQVSAHVARGMQNRQVAAALGLKDRAVKLHLMSVFRKLGISARKELVPLLDALQAEPSGARRHAGGGTAHGPPSTPRANPDPTAEPRRRADVREWAFTMGAGRDPV